MKNKAISYQVKSVLERSVGARNSDRLLITLVYVNYYPQYTTIKNGETYINFLPVNAPLPETIRRARQWYQANGEYLADKGVKAFRKMREEEFACDFRQTPKQKLVKQGFWSKLFKKN